MNSLRLFSILLAVLFTQCSADPHAANGFFTTDPFSETDSSSVATCNYDSLKQVCAAKKKQWNKELEALPLQEKDAYLKKCGLELHQFLVDSVFPCWYGTVWDFNGYTDIPQKGLVACGYFVTTPLKHMGFNLNRFKLAQQYSHSIVNTLCADIHDMQGYDAVLAHLSASDAGLYVVGLDNHVGFISIEKTGIYFIHASYASPGYVLKEYVAESAVFRYSKRFVVGAFTGNMAVLKKWLKNDAIVIVP